MVKNCRESVERLLGPESVRMIARLWEFGKKNVGEWKLYSGGRAFVSAVFHISAEVSQDNPDLRHGSFSIYSADSGAN